MSSCYKVQLEFKCSVTKQTSWNCYLQNLPLLKHAKREISLFLNFSHLSCMDRCPIVIPLSICPSIPSSAVHPYLLIIYYL